MVISYSSTEHVGVPAQPDTSESLDEPPIRKRPESPNLQPKSEVPQSPHPVPISKDDTCQAAHIFDVEHIATQLGVDVR